MTEASRKSDGAKEVKMTEPRETGPTNETSETNAPQGTSPTKTRVHSATSPEAPTKSSKKRRKVNHGKAIMSCTINGFDSLADFGFLI